MTSAVPLSVLYADVSGSTRLYEQHGDDAARTDVATCLEILSAVAGRFSGEVVKTIGDEVMCRFTDPTQAVLAANEMQRAVRDAGKAGRFLTGPLHIKVGLHHGPGVEHGGDIFGEAAVLAQHAIAQAKADQIVTSRETLEALPVEFRASSRFLDRVELSRREGESHLDTIELLWEVSDLTQTVDTDAVVPLPNQTRLEVRYRGHRFELGEQRPRLSVGRTADNDLVVSTRLASRNHAELEYRRGRFELRDMSSNGTFLLTENGRLSRVKGEFVPLRSGRGQIGLGGPPDTNPEGVIDYECE